MKKILTVPDLLIFIEQEESILKRSEYKILTATTGEEALKIHRSERVDLIVVDLDMPRITGDKLCSYVKNDKSLSNAYVILVCPGDKSDKRRCEKSKADFCISKPIDGDLLLTKIREVLKISIRGSGRVPLRITVVASSGKTFHCFARDLSASGILIETDRVLHKGDSVGCLFCLTNSREIVVNGVVARVKIEPNNIYQYGIRFSHLPANYRFAIEELIRKHV